MMSPNLRSEGAHPDLGDIVSLSSLPNRQKFAAAMASAEAILAHSKAVRGDGATMTAPPNEPPANDPPANDPPANQPKPEATDETGVKLGFPSETKVEDMTDAQKAAYWRNEAKKQQKRVPGNLDQLQQDAQAWQQYQASQKPPAEQQAEQLRQQTEAQVRLEVAKDSALAILRTNLHTRGKNAEEIDELVKFVNPESFLTSEKKIDTGAVTSYLDRVAPTGSGGGGGGLPGQGRHEQSPADRAAAGKTEAERRGFTKADRSKSSLIPR